MSSRFQQFVISDSDEDSSGSAVAARREMRSNKSGGAALSVASPPAHASTKEYRVEDVSDFPDNASKSSISFHATTNNSSIKVPAKDTSGIPFQSQPLAPERVPSVRSQTMPTPGADRGSQHASAPPAETPTAQSATPAQKTPRTMSELSTPRQTNDTLSELSAPHADAKEESVAADGHKKRRVVKHNKVVVRRRRGDPNDPGEVVRMEERVIRPGRDDTTTITVPSSRPSVTNRAGGPQQPPPPRRLSPRAQQRASSRSATPRAARTDGGDGTPLIPASRAQDHRIHSAPTSDSELDTPRFASDNETPREAPVVPSHPSSHAAGTPAMSEPSATAKTNSSISFNSNKSGTPVSASRELVSQSAARPRPTIPSPSALERAMTEYSMDDEGNMYARHQASVKQQVTADGRTVWVYVPSHVDGSNVSVREIRAPPKHLSQRAQEIMDAKRRSVEASVKKRHAEKAANLVIDSAMRPRHRYTFPPDAFYTAHVRERHQNTAAQCNQDEWNVHAYDTEVVCAKVRESVNKAGQSVIHAAAELTVRTLQPIQASSDAQTLSCSCVVYGVPMQEEVAELLQSPEAMENGFKRYLNLQPLQLANLEVHDVTDKAMESPIARGRRQSMHDVSPASFQKTNPQRGIATLGGLWCTVEALREDGRPAATTPNAAPTRRVMRVCGGEAVGTPLRDANGKPLDVRCYEVMLFPKEATNPAGVNYGSEGLTLGQLISPAASSFPLTPRIVDDPIALREFKRKLMASKPRDVIAHNNEDDRLTFFKGSQATARQSADALRNAMQYVLVTLVSISTRQKHSIELTLVMLPFTSVTREGDGGKVLAEIPRFDPLNVSTARRVQSVSLSFPTKASFISAYKALLWATECNIVDILPSEDEANGYMTLRVSATTSPLTPWMSSFGEREDATVPKSDTYLGHALDFAVLTMAPAIEGAGDASEPLKLDDFVIQESEGRRGSAAGEDQGSPAAAGAARRRSSIFTSTLMTPDPQQNQEASEDDKDGDSAAVGAKKPATTVVGLTSFGVVRRAVNQKTSQVYDVRVIPRNRARMMPIYSGRKAYLESVKTQEEYILQQDVEAAIFMEYASRLPFVSQIYGVLVDEQRYYVFQEPWISALALEDSKAEASRNALEYNPSLKNISESTTVMSLKDFVHGLLHTDLQGRLLINRQESRLQIVQLLCSQLLLLITSLHGKGMLLGPCPPQRLLVRLQNAAQTGTAADDAAAEGADDDGAESLSSEKNKQPITSDHIHLFVQDIGINTQAWSYERQQCGVLEYLSPMYVLGHMAGEDARQESRPWTTRDDWWTFLCITFELLALDDTALLEPTHPSDTLPPTPTLSHFTNPLEVLELWKDILTDDTVMQASSVTTTVAQRTRHYVHKRVLHSIALLLDGWIGAKAEEVEYFGSNGRKKGSRATGTGARQSASIGVSLSSMYMRTAREAMTPSTVSGMSILEDEAMTANNGPQSGGPRSVLQEMPWVFYYRELVDSVLDVVFPDDSKAAMPCSVHGASLHMLSHPFFHGMDLGEVFDGTYTLPPAASAYFRRHMFKTKVREQLAAYRARVLRGSPQQRGQARLMIATTEYNMAGDTTTPLLLLSARDALDGDESYIDESGAMVSGSRGASSVVSPRGSISPRSRSQSSTPWVQQSRLRQMYSAEELQSIADVENEVRGALQTHKSRENSYERPVVAMASTTSSHRGEGQMPRSVDGAADVPETEATRGRLRGPSQPSAGASSRQSEYEDPAYTFPVQKPAYSAAPTSWNPTPQRPDSSHAPSAPGSNYHYDAVPSGRSINTDSTHGAALADPLAAEVVHAMGPPRGGRGTSESSVVLVASDAEDDRIVKQRTRPAADPQPYHSNPDQRRNSQRSNARSTASATSGASSRRAPSAADRDQFFSF